MNTYKQVKNLLSEGTTNVKTAKNALKTYILYLAPANTILTHNLCPFASDGCKKACLYSAGRGRFSNVQEARINKAKFWAYDREKFYKQLDKELAKIFDKAIKGGYKVAIRLNGTSDIDHIDLLKRYTGIDWLQTNSMLFYDYTKNPNHIKKYLNTPYKLTFSLSENNRFLAFSLLDLGANIAAVFSGKLPITYNGFTVIDGDESDLRYFDPKGVIVGLKAKGEAKKDMSGFVIQSPENASINL